MMRVAWLRQPSITFAPLQRWRRSFVSDDMDWIAPGLAIGNLEDALAHDRLREQGIRSILTVSQFPNLGTSGFVWRFVPLLDGPGNSSNELLRAVDELAALHTEAPAVLIHCAEGKSRSVLVASLYLSRLERLSLEDAYERVRRTRTVAAIDDELWKLGALIAAGEDGFGLNE